MADYYRFRNAKSQFATKSTGLRAESYNPKTKQTIERNVDINKVALSATEKGMRGRSVGKGTVDDVIKDGQESSFIDTRALTLSEAEIKKFYSDMLMPMVADRQFADIIASNTNKILNRLFNTVIIYGETDEQPGERKHAEWKIPQASISMIQDELSSAGIRLDAEVDYLPDIQHALGFGGSSSSWRKVKIKRVVIETTITKHKQSIL